MAWNKQVTADNVILRCMEDKGLYQLTNRSYDSLVQPGATEVVRPKLASMVVKKNTGTAVDHADRKKTKDDTSMVTTLWMSMQFLFLLRWLQSLKAMTC